jgi:hypothetical protein
VYLLSAVPFVVLSSVGIYRHPGATSWAPHKMLFTCPIGTATLVQDGHEHLTNARLEAARTTEDGGGARCHLLLEH